jgi:hypothetical protein
MHEPTAMQALRADPLEWHRRGMSSPLEIERIVSTRLGFGTHTDPTYSDFFTATA